MALPGEDARRCAVGAACSAGLLGASDAEAIVLKWSRKSLVVRLQPQPGRPFVAKRKLPNSAECEAWFYERVLPHLGSGHLEFLSQWYDDDFGWLFLEDGGDVTIDREDPEGRLALGRLLGRLAAVTSQMSEGAVSLRRYSSDYFEDVISTLAATLAAAIPAVDHGWERDALRSASMRLERLISIWPRVEQFLSDGPEAICHSDVAPKNMRLLPGERGLVLLDWETAGWGSAAIDLGCMAVSTEDDPLLKGFGQEYAAEQRSLLQVARFGRLLRIVRAMKWATSDLGTTSAARGIGSIRKYCDYLDEAFDGLETVAPWGGS